MLINADINAVHGNVNVGVHGDVHVGVNVDKC
jgi:hypothetical protein